MCHKFGKQLAHNSWPPHAHQLLCMRISADMQAHNSWSPHAHQLLCMRISADMQAHNSCCATGDTYCINNRFHLFQQHILALPTKRRGCIINL